MIKNKLSDNENSILIELLYFGMSCPPRLEQSYLHVKTKLLTINQDPRKKFQKCLLFYQYDTENKIMRFTLVPFKIFIIAHYSTFLRSILLNFFKILSILFIVLDHLCNTVQLHIEYEIFFKPLQSAADSKLERQDIPR